MVNYSVDYLIRLRLPKIVSRFFCKKDFALHIPCYGYIVDGYYQAIDDYVYFSEECISNAITSIRRTLIENNILSNPSREKIMHLRLTDFFISSQDARAHVKKCLSEIDSDMDFVTDQDDILLEELKNFKSQFKLNLIPTVNMKAWDLFTLMSSYKKIITNGSSLPLWAAILARTELITDNKNHFALWSKLVRL